MIDTISIDTTEFDVLAIELENITTASKDILAKHMEKLGETVAKVEQVILRDKEFAYTGQLADSVWYKVEGDTVFIGPNQSGANVVIGRIYGVWKGNDPRPKGVPTSVLKQWMSFKGIDPYALFPIWRQTAQSGTSMYRKNKFGKKGWDFPEQTLASPETIQAMQTAIDETGAEIIGTIGK